MTNVCIIGLGYIGLPTASLLAVKGFQVHGVDVNSAVVEALRNGNCIIEEPSLDAMVRSASSSGRLTAGADPAPADVFVISVPTPFKEGHKPDLKHVFAALESIAPYVKPGNLVILESTVPVGTTSALAARLAALRPDLTIAGNNGAPAADQVCVAHCPERVLPGNILHELVANDRIVGGVDGMSTQRGLDFYRSFAHGAVQGTDADTAEMVKLAENSFRDVNIAYANELSLICDRLGLDVWKVISLANRHPRVNILRPGPGVGGHCIAVDPWFIVDSAPDLAALINTARQVNDAKPKSVIDRAVLAAKEKPNAVIACLGIAFKPDVDDLRQSPAMQIVESLAETMPVLVCEPHIRKLPDSLAKLGNARLAGIEECLNADVILALVNHAAFRQIDRDALAGKTVIDACGLWQNRE